MESSKRYNLVLVRDNCALFAFTPLYLGWAIRRCHLNFSPADPRCHGNEFWDTIDNNSAPVKDNCVLFAPIPYFRARAFRRCHLNLSPADPRCHGNEFWEKIDYNSAPVKGNCALFAPTRLFSGLGYPMVSFKFVPRRLLLPWQLTVLIQRRNWLQQTLLTSHIIFSLHQLPLPARSYSENSK